MSSLLCHFLLSLFFLNTIVPRKDIFKSRFFWREDELRTPPCFYAALNAGGIPKQIDVTCYSF